MTTKKPTTRTGRQFAQKSRERIKAGMLIDKLQKCALGELELTTSQISASKLLLDKVLPNLKAVEFTETNLMKKDVRELTDEELNMIIWEGLGEKKRLKLGGKVSPIRN